MGFFNRSSRNPPEAQERGFQKISGRKLESQFSPGMQTGPGGGLTTLGGDPITFAGPAFAAGAAKEVDIGKQKDFGGPGSPTSPEDRQPQASDVASWYRDSSGSSGLAPAGPGFPQARYPSSAYSVDASGAMIGTATQVPMSRSEEAQALRPSPARTPTVHHPPTHAWNQPGGLAPPQQLTPGGHGAGAASIHDSPPVSPTPQRGTLGRSHPSFDGSRGSRFTENVG